MSDGGHVTVKAEDLLKWLDDGKAWQDRGRELFKEGFSTKQANTQTASPNSSGNEAWRTEPASEKQLAILEKNKIPPRAGLTKGEASDLIDKIFKGSKK